MVHLEVLEWRYRRARYLLLHYKHGTINAILCIGFFSLNIKIKLNKKLKALTIISSVTFEKISFKCNISTNKNIIPTSIRPEKRREP